MFYLTHFIQVILSVILITIGVSGYLGRGKYPVYFEFIFNNHKFKINKNIVFPNECIQITILEVDSCRENVEIDEIKENLKQAYLSKVIDEDTYLHLSQKANSFTLLSENE